MREVQYVYADKRIGGELYKHLRCQKKRRKRYGSYDFRGRIHARKGIELRSEAVDLRERLGDWEVDTMIGKNHRGVLVQDSPTSRAAPLEEMFVG